MISHSEASDASDGCLVKVRVDGCSGTIVLNNATRKNAINREMLGQLHQAFSDLHQEKKVSAVILTGAGDSFSAGSDLEEIKRTMQEESTREQAWFADCMAQKDVIESMLRFPKPIIAAVNGPALGLGAALVLGADIVVATEDVSFGFPETKRGLVPGIAAPLLAFRLGSSRAANLLLRGELLDGNQGRDIGIVRHIVAQDLVWAKADAIARDLVGSDAASIAMTKRLLNETIGETLFTQLSSGAAATASARTTASATEGINAFLEKRPPNWK